MGVNDWHSWKQEKQVAEITNNTLLEFGSSNCTSVPPSQTLRLYPRTLSCSLSQTHSLCELSLSLSLSSLRAFLGRPWRSPGAPNNTVSSEPLPHSLSRISNSFFWSFWFLIFQNRVNFVMLELRCFGFVSMKRHRFCGNSLKFFIFFSFATQICDETLSFFILFCLLWNLWLFRCTVRLVFSRLGGIYRKNSGQWV